MLQRLCRADQGDLWARLGPAGSPEWTVSSDSWRDGQLGPVGPFGGDVVATRLAERALHQKDYRFSRCVACECRDGVLTLSGRVPSYYLKQLAQAAVAGIDGVNQVDNRLDVFVDSNPLPRRPR